MPTIREIQAHVCAHFGVTYLDLISDRRGRAIARPRQVAMWLARHLTVHSIPEIGRYFGGRDHTTVLHALKVVEKAVEAGDEWGKAAHELRLMINNGERTTLKLVAA